MVPQNFVVLQNMLGIINLLKTAFEYFKDIICAHAQAGVEFHLKKWSKYFALQFTLFTDGSVSGMINGTVYIINFYLCTNCCQSLDDNHRSRLPQRMIHKQHKLSGFQKFQDQPSEHSAHWMRDDESCPNRAKIRSSSFQIHFCSQSSFCKSPRNRPHVAGI